MYVYSGVRRVVVEILGEAAVVEEEAVAEDKKNTNTTTTPEKRSFSPLSFLSRSTPLLPSSSTTKQPPSSQPNQVTWKALLAATKSRSRPDNVVVSSTASESTQQAVLKVRVLANALDCVVNHPDLSERRKFISRILKLSKTTQRHLMGMIERRILAFHARNHPSSSKQDGGGDGSSSGGNSSSRGSTPSTKKSRPKSILRKPLTNDVVGSSSSQSPAPQQQQLQQQQSSSSEESTACSSDCDDVPSIQPAPSNVRSPRQRTVGGDSSSFSSTATPQRNNVATTTTPAPTNHRAKQVATPGSAVSSSSSRSSVPFEFRSPTAVMDSPETAQRWIYQLQKNNQELQSEVAMWQEREMNLQKKQQENRQEMMKLEASYINQQNEMEEEHKTQIRDMQRTIDEYEKERQFSLKTQQQVKQLEDELEVAHHSQMALSDAQERLHTYKERIEELQDVKDALKREQDAHGKAVEDVVRLQLEVKGLQQARRQLEDYKTRAIEAEVNFVECQEHLRRLELELADADEVKEKLSHVSKVQKQQIQDMIHRIKEETQRSIDSSSSNGSPSALGQGLSELNPQVKSELTRLRHENLQLRAFAAKRQDDAVEQLESKLDDSRRLANKYKDEYLNTKDQLQSTESELNQTRRILTKQVEELKNQVRLRESHLLTLTEQVEESNQALDKTKIALAKSEEQTLELQKKIQQVTSSLEDWTERAQNSRNQVHDLTERLQATERKLEQTEKLASELQQTSDSWESNAKAMEEEVLKTQEELNDLTENLASTRTELSQSQSAIQELEEQVERAAEHNRDLDAKFQEESQSNQKAMEATKQILTSRYQQQLEDQSTHFNRLLEEQTTARQKLEETLQQEKESLQQDLHALKAQSKEELETLQEESEDRIAQLQEELKQRVAELQEEVAQTEKDGEDKRQDLIRKGRDLINDCKERAHHEILKLDDENKELDQQLQEERYQRKEYEDNMRNTVAALKSKLEQSTTRINALTQEADDLQEHLQIVKVSKDKLQDDNDRYRRQLTGSGGGAGGGGGRFGAQQFEKLQKEFNSVVEENRGLRRQARMYQDGSGSMAGIAESTPTMSRRDRGSTITQLRQEYEETIANLNDEKRELVMKNTAALTEVERAETKTWEREQEMDQLQSQLTSLKLELERVRMNQQGNDDNEYRAHTPTRSSATSFSSSSRSRTPPRPPQSSSSSSSSSIAQQSYPNTPPRPGGVGSALSTLPTTPLQDSNRKLQATRSPSIDRALREKEQHENMLRQKISSLRRTPTKLIPFRPIVGGNPPHLHDNYTTTTTGTVTGSSSRMMTDYHQFGDTI